MTDSNRQDCKKNWQAVLPSEKHLILCYVLCCSRCWRLGVKHSLDCRLKGWRSTTDIHASTLMGVMVPLLWYTDDLNCAIQKGAARLPN